MLARRPTSPLNSTWPKTLDMDSQSIRADLGYVEPVNRLDALFQTVEWDREHPPRHIDPAQFDYAAEDALLFMP